MKELSIFVDESGDFGHYNTKYAPQYVFSLVLHEQQNSIEEQIKQFEREMFNMGYLNHVVHTSPLIRKEDVYCNLSPNERRSIFIKLFFFAKNLPIKYKTFVFERKQCIDESQLKNRIEIELSRFIELEYEYFSSFDKVILYYDNGQKQLASVLNKVLDDKLVSFGRRLEVKPYKYKLLQVADMVCTLELLRIKAENNRLNISEMAIFHSVRDLKKDFLKKLAEKEF